MTDLELEKLYQGIEAAIDNLQEGEVKAFEAPDFTASELMSIPDILKHLQEHKYKDTIRVNPTKSLRTVVKKLKKEVPVETSVFDNLVFEKSEEEVQAKIAYSICLSNNHDLIETKTTFNTPLLVCKKCQHGYTFKLNSGAKKVAKVIRVKI